MSGEENMEMNAAVLQPVLSVTERNQEPLSPRRVRHDLANALAIAGGTIELLLIGRFGQLTPNQESALRQVEHGLAKLETIMLGSTID